MKIDILMAKLRSIKKRKGNIEIGVHSSIGEDKFISEPLIAESWDYYKNHTTYGYVILW